MNGSWRTLTVTSSIYCLLAFLCGVLGFAAGAVALLFAQTQLTSIFAALGSGNYWKRLAITQSCLVVIPLSYIGGLSIATVQLIHQESIHVLFAISVLGSASSQFIYGLLRLTRGWRLHNKSTDRGPAYNLQDLFALTLFLAIVISATNAVFFSGSVTNDSSVPLVYGLFFLLATVCYGLPTLFSIFCFSESEQSFFVQLIMVVTAGFLVLMPLMAMGVGAVVIGPLIIFLCGCSACTTLPLMLMRNRGFVLTNGKEKHIGGERAERN